MNRPDVLIIGSGIGGATMAASLAPTGKSILILERGEHLVPSALDRDDGAIFAQGVFRPSETWLDGNDTPFNPGNYYYVGGNSKFYGAVLIRYRAQDFAPVQHMGGRTQGWPFDYAELEPFYAQAEQLYQVRGQIGQDPTEPPHTTPYPHPPIPDEPAIAALRARLAKVGLHPASLPLGVDLDRWLARARTPWDAFPDTTGGKMDAETAALATALRHRNVQLRTKAQVTRLHTRPDGTIGSVELASGERLEAGQIVLATGAVQTAALLLRSANADFPTGLANRSDQVGRNFMNHNCSAVLAIHPLWKNDAIYQKTLMINNYYLSGGPDDVPLGNIQLLGKISGKILHAASNMPRVLAHWIARHSVDLYAMSEDLPDPESRVTLQNGQIRLDWKRSNWQAHLALVAKLKRKLREAGYPIVLSRPFDRRTPSHQCGTARMGRDPRASVVDPWCRAHDHANLFITDASVLPRGCGQLT